MISCVIPCHNASATVERAVRSALAQPGKMEVVVVDDASTDGTADRVAALFEADIAAGRLLQIRLASNHGPGAARNIGAAACSGDYLIFLDADDEHLSPFYDACAQWLDANTQFAGIELGAEVVRAGDHAELLTAPDPRYEVVLHSAPWTVIVRRACFWLAGGFPVSPGFRTPLAGEDIVFKTQLKQRFRIGKTPAKLVRHYVFPGSHTDKYLSRTEIVDGQIVFRHMYAGESDGSWQSAAVSHAEAVERQAAWLVEGLGAGKQA